MTSHGMAPHKTESDGETLHNAEPHEVVLHSAESLEDTLLGVVPGSTTSHGTWDITWHGTSQSSIA